MKYDSVADNAQKATRAGPMKEKVKARRDIHMLDMENPATFCNSLPPAFPVPTAYIGTPGLVEAL